MRLPQFFRKRLPLKELAAVPGSGRPGAVGILGALAGLSVLADSSPGGGGAGGGYQTYRRMQHDPQVRACLSTKKFAVLSQGWEIHAESEEPEDVAVADFVRDQLDGMKGSILDVLYDVLDALALGMSLAEINYTLIESGEWVGMVGLLSIKSKDPADYQLETDQFLNLTALRGVQGESYDVRKFLIYSYMPAYQNPLGQSDLRAAYQAWRVKHQLLVWWAKYLEKFGMPTVVGSYDATKGYGTDQQRELLGIVAQVHNESAVVLPSDMEMKLLETSRSGGALFEELVAYLDRAIAKSILGQTLTSDSGGGAGGSTFALGSVHQDVLMYYLHKIQRDLEGAVGEQILKPLVLMNFAAGTACPRFSLGQIDDGRMQTAAALVKDMVAGKVVAPDEPWIREYLGLPAAPVPDPMADPLPVIPPALVPVSVPDPTAVPVVDMLPPAPIAP